MFQQEKLYDTGYELNQASLKFIRRKDLSAELRLHIACTVLCFNDYGTVTNLAKKYGVSRTFIYNLRSQLIISGWVIFGMLEVQSGAGEEINKKLDIAKEILSLRLEGKCGLLGISQLLKRKGKCNTSIGYISEFLSEIGNQLSPVICKKEGITYGLIFASDEVFSAGCPVLITVDPVSSAILRMELAQDRKSGSWEVHWQSLIDAGIIPLYLVSDDGVGMKSAKENIFPDSIHQTDTFHAVAHRLGVFFRVLEQQTYAEIAEEYKKEKLLYQSKSKPVIRRRFAEYRSAKAKANDFVKLYEDFSFWYELMIDQFQLFDKKGQLLTLEEATKNMTLAIQEIEKLDCFFENKNKQVTKNMTTIKNLLPQLFLFLSEAKEILEGLYHNASCEKERLAIQAFCRAYQFQKNRIKAKKYKSKKYFSIKEEEELIVAEILLENTKISFDELHKKMYKKLDQIVQSSAMVETINSIVRSYFNASKNQINQAQLNLIRFYHNHRRYVQGKRKGSTPMELLTGEKQEQDWLDLLLIKTNRIAA